MTPLGRGFVTGYLLGSLAFLIMLGVLTWA